MSVIAEVVVDGNATSHNRFAQGRPFLDRLAVRLSEEYGVDQQAIRELAAPLVAYYADARVQAFIGILVEKQLREDLRAGRGRGGAMAAHEESEAVAG